MYQLAQEAAQVFVLVFSVVTGTGVAIGERQLDDFVSLPACMEALPGVRKQFEQSAPSLRSSLKFECRPKKPG